MRFYDEQLTQMRQRFAADTDAHQLTVLHDDGLYRHLRCSRPDSWTYGFDVVTWPGYLSVVGDAGDFVFSRIRDMFEFFESEDGRVNPQYWGEKLQAPRPAAAERYSERAARACVLDWLRDAVEYGSVHDRDREYDEQGPLGGRAAFELHREVKRSILDHDLYHHEALRQALDHFEHDGIHIHDAWEWNTQEFDWQFLWCCHAIVWAIARYRLQSKA